MAKVTFSKLNLKIDNTVETFEFNGQIIEVKKYIPANQKLQMISNIINNINTANPYNYQNPLMEKIFIWIEVVENYTNITFTPKQKEDCSKLFDAFESTGLFEKIYETAGEDLGTFNFYASETLKKYYKHRNSLTGMFEAMNTEYTTMDANATALRDKLADPSNMEFLKNVITKLG